MSCIDRQTYVSWSLPKNWHILLTTNPDNGDFHVTSLDDAQKTRFISCYLKFDIEVWSEWAERQKIDTRCINFLMMHPELVQDKCNPRSITTFFNSISSLSDFDADLPLIQMIGEGSVGVEFTTMFTSFIHNKLDKMITPKEILTNKDEKYVLSSLESCVGEIGKSYRSDIASVLSNRIVNYTLLFAEENPIEQFHIDRLNKLCLTAGVFTNDLKYSLVKRVINGNKVKFAKMLSNPEIVKMSLA